MRRLHFVVGTVFLLAFVASGQFMDLRYDHLRGMDDATRLLFRSTHIYLLFLALVNLTLGLYLTARPPGWRLWLQRIGSVPILVAPFVQGVGFLTEPWMSGLERPYSRTAVIGGFVGMMFHLVGAWPRRRAARAAGLNGSAAAGRRRSAPAPGLGTTPPLANN